MGGEGEVEAVASGQASARGSTCSKEKATAELLDTVGRCEDDGGYGYSGEVAAAASAMVEEGEGEVMGEKGGVQGLGGGSWRVVQLVHGLGGKQVAPWRARARRRHLGACSGGSKQLTGHGPAQCWAARWAAR